MKPTGSHLDTTPPIVLTTVGAGAFRFALSQRLLPAQVLGAWPTGAALVRATMVGGPPPATSQ